MSQRPRYISQNAKASLYTDASKTRLLAQGHPEARFLVVREGAEIDERTFRNYGHLDTEPASGPAADSASDPQSKRKLSARQRAELEAKVEKEGGE